MVRFLDSLESLSLRTTETSPKSTTQSDIVTEHGRILTNLMSLPTGCNDTPLEASGTTVPSILCGVTSDTSALMAAMAAHEAARKGY